MKTDLIGKNISIYVIFQIIGTVKISQIIDSRPRG